MPIRSLGKLSIALGILAIAGSTAWPSRVAARSEDTGQQPQASLAAPTRPGSSAPAATPAPVASSVLFDWGSSDWRYLQVPSGGAPPGFELPSFDDSSFGTGSAAFASGGPCGVQALKKTTWAPNSDLVVRKGIAVPDGVAVLVLSVLVDNDVDVFWDGVNIMHVTHEDCPDYGSPFRARISSPSGGWGTGTHVLAIRAVDRGNQAFLDAMLETQDAFDTSHNYPEDSYFISGLSSTMRGHSEPNATDKKYALLSSLADSAEFDLPGPGRLSIHEWGSGTAQLFIDNRATSDVHNEPFLNGKCLGTIQSFDVDPGNHHISIRFVAPGTDPNCPITGWGFDGFDWDGATLGGVTCVDATDHPDQTPPGTFPVDRAHVTVVFPEGLTASKDENESLANQIADDFELSRQTYEDLHFAPLDKIRIIVSCGYIRSNAPRDVILLSGAAVVSAANSVTGDPNAYNAKLLELIAHETLHQTQYAQDAKATGWSWPTESTAEVGSDLIPVLDDDPSPQLDYMKKLRLTFSAADKGLDGKGQSWTDFRNLFYQANDNPNYNLGALVQYLGEQYGDVGTWEGGGTWEAKVANFMQKLVVSGTRFDALANAIQGGREAAMRAVLDFWVTAYIHRYSQDPKYQFADELYLNGAGNVSNPAPPQYPTLLARNVVYSAQDASHVEFTTDLASPGGTAGSYEVRVFDAISSHPTCVRVDIHATLDRDSKSTLAGRFAIVRWNGLSPTVTSDLTGSVPMDKSPVTTSFCGVGPSTVLGFVAVPGDQDQTFQITVTDDVTNLVVSTPVTADSPLTPSQGLLLVPVTPTLSSAFVKGLTTSSFSLMVDGRSEAIIRAWEDPAVYILLAKDQTLTPGRHSFSVSVGGVAATVAGGIYVAPGALRAVPQSSQTSSTGAAGTFAETLVADGHVLGLMNLDFNGSAGLPLNVAFGIVDDRAALRSSKVSVTVTDPAGHSRTFTLADDAAHGDGRAFDGLYGGRLWATDLPGTYTIVATASGIDSAGVAYSLADSQVVTLGPKTDTDGDGVADGAEVLMGLDPANPADGAIDIDNDGLSWAAELRNGTDPYLADTDGGGETDGSEAAAGRDPLNGADDVHVTAVQLDAVPGDGRVVNVTVGTDDGTTPVRVWRVGPDGTPTTIETVSGASTSMTDGPLTQGTYAYYAVAVPGGGVIPTSVATGPVAVADDVTRPIASITVDGDQTYARTTTLAIQVKDPSEPIAAIRVAETLDSLNAAAWQPYTGITTLEVGATQGQHAVYAQIKDQAGLESDPIESGILLDSVAPTSSVGPLPATVTVPSLSVPVTASDEGSGLSRVQLFTRLEGTTDWSLVAETVGAPIEFTFPFGEGRYELASVAIDVAGNVELQQDSAIVRVAYDHTPPASVAGPFSGAIASPLSVPFWSSDGARGSGVASADLFWRFEASGSTSFSDWAFFANTTTPEQPFSVPLDRGDGTYQFYTVATDLAGNREVKAPHPDISAVLGGGAPVSVIAPIPPATNATHISLSVSFSDALYVQIYEHFIPLSGNPSPWSQVASGGQSPFDIPLNGDGRYEFYSIATGSQGSREAVPETPDAWTVVDTQAPSSRAGTLPATVSSTTLQVPFAASAGQGTDLTSVELWGSGPGQNFQLLASGIASPFNVTLSHGPGEYDFYTIGVDAAGNRENPPCCDWMWNPIPDTSTILDPSVPLLNSAIVPPAVTSVTSPSISLEYTAAYPSGTGSVELWQRFKPDNSPTFGDWSQLTTTSAWPIPVALTLGDGRYEFYTRAVDSLGGREDAPGSADISILLDRTAPTSTLDALPTAITQMPYDLHCQVTDAGSGVASTTVWSRWRANASSSWPAWTQAGTCGSNATFSFSFPSGEGYYEFATSAVDMLGNAEPTPIDPEANTYFGPAPESHVLPLTGATANAQVNVWAVSNTSFEIWERYLAPGSSHFTDWTLVGSASAGGHISFPFGPDGRYEFYSIAVSASGIRETKPPVAEAFVVHDTVSPTSTIGQVPVRTSLPTIAVPFTASDGNGSGVATMYVYTRYRANQDAAWSYWNDIVNVNMPATSADIPLTSGQGFYQVALMAQDQAGNYEQWPPTQVAGTHYTTGGDPSSWVGALPVGTNKTPLDVPYSADFASGSGQVELWESVAPGGSSTYSTPALVATVTAPGPLVAALAGGEGSSYRFYTIAIDGQSEVREAVPASPDASIIYDTTPPTSTMDPWYPIATNFANAGNNVEVDADASGVAKVDIYYRVAPPGTSDFGPWQPLKTQTNPSATVFYVAPFASCQAACDGTYQFTSVATDGAGNAESGPDGAKTSVILDTVRPTSSIGVVPASTRSISLSVPFTATDDSSGVAGVDIYERFQAAGSSDWSNWTPVYVADPSSPSPRTVYLMSGDGRYEFFSNAWDVAGNGEPYPEVAQAFTVLDRTAPTTSVTSLPAHISSPSQTISYTAQDNVNGSGMHKLEIQRQFKTSGSYGNWLTLSTVNDPPSSGTAAVTLADGYGTYHFRTIATDYAGNTTTSATTTDTVLDAPILATQAGPLAAAVKSTSLSVPYTVTSGTATSIQLLQRWTTPGGTPSGGYTQVASKSSPGTSGTFTVTLSNPGLYEFYTQGVGSSGTEPAPTSADAFTVLDTTAPTSQASAVTTSRNTNTVPITFTANDNANGSGLASVDLYQRFTAPGGSAGSYSKIVSGATSPVTVTLTAEGKYEFYTLATDKAGNAEAAPSSPDAYTVYDVTAPVSKPTPAAGVHSTTLSVPFTATDANGSGVSSVQLYERYTPLGGTPSGSFTTVGSPTTTSPISVTLGSVGRYEFYTRATDAAGNLEAAPTSGYATTIYETTAPTSQAGSLPALINGTSLSVPFTAADETNGSGIGSVTLYVSYAALGSTSWSSYSSIGSPATGTSGSFNVTLTSGSGSYRFYTRATDVAGNTEAAPSTADATTVLDNVAPTSSITAPPSTSSASSISLTYSASDNTNGSGFQSVEFWYRYRASDGATPGAWTAGGTSTAASGSFTLTFGSGAGIYDILTVAIDKAGNREGGIANPPASATAGKWSLRATSWAAGAKVNTDTGTALQDNAAYAVGSDGTVYAVWEDSRNTNTDIYFSSRNPTTGVWAAETKLNADTGSAGQRTPSIAIDGSGNLYVVWADDRNGSTNTDIYFAKRTGTTWSANIKVNSDTATAVQSNPRISVSSAGIAVAVWYDARSSQVNIYSARLPAGSTTWSTNYQVTANTSAVKAAPDVAVATDGTAWAAWQDNQTGGGDIYVASLGPTATAWSTNTKVSDDSGSSSLDKSPRIGLTSANLPVVAYLDGRTTNAQVRVVNRTSGGTWNASVQVSDSSAKPATGLALAVKADGGVIVAWDDTRSTSAIWGAQCEAGSGTSSVTRCGPNEKWSDQAGASYRPTLIATTSKVYLGWRDDTAGGGDIRIRLRNPS